MAVAAGAAGQRDQPAGAGNANRGGGRGQGNRNQGRAGNRNNNNSNRNSFPRTTRFEGSEEALKGFIFDYTGNKNPDQYIRTSKQLVTYFGSTSKLYPSEFCAAIQELELVDPQEPAQPGGNPNQFQVEIWNTDYK